LLNHSFISVGPQAESTEDLIINIIYNFAVLLILNIHCDIIRDVFNKNVCLMIKALIFAQSRGA